jgi:hypothetical protein
MPRLVTRLALLIGLRRLPSAAVRTWRDPAPALCVGQPVHGGRALSVGEAP